MGQFREGDKLIDIVRRQPLDERSAITDIANAYLPTSSGKAIPLTQIAKPVFAWKPGVMWREGRDYAITVQSDIVEGLQGATVSQGLQPRLKALEAQWHGSGMTGYRIEGAGAVEESSKGSLWRSPSWADWWWRPFWRCWRFRPCARRGSASSANRHPPGQLSEAPRFLF